MVLCSRRPGLSRESSRLEDTWKNGGISFCNSPPPPSPPPPPPPHTHILKTGDLNLPFVRDTLFPFPWQVNLLLVDRDGGGGGEVLPEHPLLKMSHQSTPFLPVAIPNGTAALNGREWPYQVATCNGSPAEEPAAKEEDVSSGARGLASLVMQCFGKPLDKSQQLSDWERRPLRREQIRYAGREHVRASSN